MALKKAWFAAILAALAAAGLAGFCAAPAMAAGSYHYVNASGGGCTNVSFPQADWFGPGLGAANAVSQALADTIAGNDGGKFAVGTISTGETDLVYPALTVSWAQMHVGGTSSDSVHTYVSVDIYYLSAGDCPVSARTEGKTYLCYSQWQIWPDPWYFSEAAKLLASGEYWRPVAEREVVTPEPLGSGWYLACPGTKNGLPHWQYSSTTVVDLGGDVINIPELTGVLGYYPVGLSFKQ